MRLAHTMKLPRMMKRSGRIIPLLMAGVVIVPAAAMAAGMPQLDFNTPLTISQVVWGAIIFGVLYILLSRTGLPMVASVLDERATRISKDLNEARAAKARADAGAAEAAQATAKARSESQAAINAAVEEAKKSAAAQAETLNARLEQQLQSSEAQIAQARAAAMGALRQVATATATNLVTRLTGSAPDSTRLDSAVGSVLANRGIS